MAKIDDKVAEAMKQNQPKSSDEQQHTTTEVEADKKEETTETNNDKTYTADAFREVVKQRDEAKKKLRAIEEEKTTLQKKQEEDALKSQGKYEELIKKVTEEREKEKASLNTLLKQSVLTSLGAELGIAKPEYVKLFDGEVELDGVEVKNLDELKKGMEEFKKNSPHLFMKQDNKSVPKTDNTPFKKPNTEPELDTHSKLIAAVGKSLSTWKKQ